MNLGGLDLPETTTSTPLKVHCDASHNHSTEISSGGVVFSTHTGVPIDTVPFNLGKGYDTNSAEEETIKRAISILDSYNQVQHIKVYTDSKVSIESLSNVELSVGNFESVTLDWIPREENMIADAIANKGMEKRAHSSEPKYGICD